MPINDEVSGLMNVHKKFIENPYFSAFSIMTPKDDWLCFDTKRSDIESLTEEAKRKQIFNLVVKEGEEILGSINLKDLKENEWRNKLVKVDKFLIPASKPLIDLVDQMIRDSENLERERSPLYFVQGRGNKSKYPVGILTFWDLNRAPAYILSYSILVFLEHSLLLKIRDSHDTWCDHADLIKQINRQDPQRNISYIKKFVNRPRYNYRILSKWGLQELLIFFKYDPHIEGDSAEISEDLLNLFALEKDFRNRIGHPVKLIVTDDGNFRCDLKKLQIIWKLGKKAFINFTDPKVRHSTPFLG
ncbi:MAG: hypothetical protein QXU18_14300 [Thermoplasmatales archaeon]